MVALNLSQEELGSLQALVNRSPPGTAYLRRAKIVLLANSGSSQEEISAKVEMPIFRVRQMLRAFNRERLGLFPDELLISPAFSAEEEIAEAGRQIMASLLQKAKFHETDLSTTTSVFAIHDTRKTIRRLLTSFRLFEPYYEAGLLDSYRRRFRKSMRRFSRSRDVAVFLFKLDHELATESESGALTASEIEALTLLRSHWEANKTATDEKVRAYLAKGKYQALLVEFETFTQNRGGGVPTPPDLPAPSKVRHLAPILMYEKLAAVSAYDDYIDDASLDMLHALRIQFKELRYTLEFFRPVMGPSARKAIDVVKRLLTHLGDLNDARVHLAMLAKITNQELAPAVALYCEIKKVELERLTDEFPSLWDEFDCLEWRQQLAEAVSAL